MKALIGIKKGMTRIFEGEKAVPVTVIDTQGCTLAHLDTNGFELGIGDKKKPNKAMQGRYKSLGKVPLKREHFNGTLDGEIELGSEIKPEIFEIGDEVTVKGVSKGKGFAGVVKRWGFAGGPRTHGQSDRLRAPGSIGAGTDPGRVLKGKKMGGRMGQDRVTLKNRKIVDIQDNYILLSGPVPGAKGEVVTIIKE